MAFLNLLIYLQYFGFHFYSIYRSRQLWLHCWSTFCWIPRSLWGRLHKTRLLHLRPFGRSEDKGQSIRNQVASFTTDPSLAFLITLFPPNNSLTKGSNWIICIPSPPNFNWAQIPSYSPFLFVIWLNQALSCVLCYWWIPFHIPDFSIESLQCRAQLIEDNVIVFSLVSSFRLLHCSQQFVLSPFEVFVFCQMFLKRFFRITF